MEMRLMTINLLDYIQQIPVKESGEIECPSCLSMDVHIAEEVTTLLGGPKDNNHVWKTCICRSCIEKFTCESKNGYRWITQYHGRVISGVPACFERYVLTCKCGGDFKREYMNMDGVTPATCLATRIDNGKAIREYRTFWNCEQCKTRIETDYDYWTPMRTRAS